MAMNYSQKAREYRAKMQKIYLINRNVNDESAIFKVLGTTGKIYEITLTGNPICTCPDHQQRGSRCKHILFMLVRIFNVDDPYQDEFTTKEIIEYIRKYNKNISRFNITFDEKSNCIDVGIRNMDDICVICMDDLQNGEDCVYCKEVCGRCLHKECYNVFRKINPKCPYCQHMFVIGVVK